MLTVYNEPELIIMKKISLEQVNYTVLIIVILPASMANRFTNKELIMYETDLDVQYNFISRAFVCFIVICEVQGQEPEGRSI